MPSKCALFENNTTSDPDDYAAMVQISGSADGDDLVQDIVDQGSTVNKPDIRAETAAVKPACPRRVEQGSLRMPYGVMSPGKTVSKLRSIPAPCLAQAPALKQGVGTGPHRGQNPTSPRCGPDLTQRRTTPHRDGGSTSVRCAADFKLVVRAAHPTELK